MSKNANAYLSWQFIVLYLLLPLRFMGKGVLELSKQIKASQNICIKLSKVNSVSGCCISTFSIVSIIRLGVYEEALMFMIGIAIALFNFPY